MIDKVELGKQDYLYAMESAIQLCPLYPAKTYEGRGIVMVAGGERYFTNAYVSITLLRSHGCSLPVQVWCLGPLEIDNTMKGIIESLPDVQVVDALSHPYCPQEGLTGWQCKAFAVLHSPFEKVFLLDADCFPITNVEHLIEDFSSHGNTAAVFWPDLEESLGGKTPTPTAFAATGSIRQRIPPLCSGQLYVNKPLFWAELNLVWHLNLYGPTYWYQHTNGDANTWWTSLHRLGSLSSGAKIAFRWSGLSKEGMVQYVQPRGEILRPGFIHRCREKLSLHYPNIRTRHVNEDLCFEALEDLRSRWDGRPWALPFEQGIKKDGYASRWKYFKDDISVKLGLKWDGTLDGGSAMEGYLSIVDFRGVSRVVIGPDFQKAKFLLRSTQAPLQVLDRFGSNWRGTWDFLGKHEIRLEGLE